MGQDELPGHNHRMVSCSWSAVRGNPLTGPRSLSPPAPQSICIRNRRSLAPEREGAQQWYRLSTPLKLLYERHSHLSPWFFSPPHDLWLTYWRICISFFAILIRCLVLRKYIVSVSQYRTARVHETVHHYYKFEKVRYYKTCLISGDTSRDRPMSGSAQEHCVWGSPRTANNNTSRNGPSPNSHGLWMCVSHFKCGGILLSSRGHVPGPAVNREIWAAPLPSYIPNPLTVTGQRYSVGRILLQTHRHTHTHTHTHTFSEPCLTRTSCSFRWLTS